MDIVFEIKNNQAINRNSIPAVDFETFRKTVISQDIRVINLFWQEENYKDRLYAVIADEPNKKLFVTSCFVGEEYPSLTLDKPCLHMFERLIYEEGGIKPIGHPFLKPVRKQENYDFVAASDLQTHEVAVGPVHAGIIEPGHFRFICNGERVNHLEIQLGYQHRGVETLLKKRPTIQLAESICGDSTPNTRPFSVPRQEITTNTISREPPTVPNTLLNAIFAPVSPPASMVRLSAAPARPI